MVSPSFPAIKNAHNPANGADAIKIIDNAEGNAFAGIQKPLGTIKIDAAPIDNLPKNVQDAYNGYSGSGWKGNYPGQSSGTSAGGIYRNRPKAGAIQLPTVDNAGNAIKYREFDINSKLSDAGRDAERFVIGSDGSVYYTNNHYESFTKVK